MELKKYASEPGLRLHTLFCVMEANLLTLFGAPRITSISNHNVMTIPFHFLLAGIIFAV
jgi:hypothetical protein